MALHNCKKTLTSFSCLSISVIRSLFHLHLSPPETSEMLFLIYTERMIAASDSEFQFLHFRWKSAFPS